MNRAFVTLTWSFHRRDPAAVSAASPSSSPVPRAGGSSGVFPAPPSRQSSPAPVTTRSPEPGVELHPIDEMNEDVHSFYRVTCESATRKGTGSNGSSHTAQSDSNNTVIPSNIFPPPITDKSRSTSTGSDVLLHKVDVAYGTVEATMDMKVFDEPSVHAINRDLAELGRELFEHFSSCCDDIKSISDGRDESAASSSIYSNLKDMGYPSSICGLVTSLCLAEQQPNRVEENKLYSRSFSSVADVKAQFQLMLNQPDIWFYDANVHTLESRLYLPSQRKKAKFCLV